MLNESLYFLEALKEYREPTWGLLGDGLNPADPSGNALLYEAHAAWIYRDLTGCNFAHEDFYKAVGLLRAGGGLLYRKPPSKYHDEQTHDDYIGVASAGFSVADGIRQHGESHGWFYDCWSPETTFWKALKRIATRVEPWRYLSNWHGRFPGLKEHYLISAGQKPSLWGWMKWIASIAWTVREKGNESGWLLDYLKLRIANEKYPFHWAVVLANKVYKLGLNEHYNGHISEVYRVYFGPNHPLARWSAWPPVPKA
jgi:hypothetical protein